MPSINTADITPSTLLRPFQSEQIYCSLDSMVTVEVKQELARLFPKQNVIYDFERALQAPYLDIMRRGFAVDEIARRQAAESLRKRLVKLEALLNVLSEASSGRPVNPRSPVQLKRLFYQDMALPEVWLSQKGERKLSTNREALEKLETYLYPRPLISCILAIRDISKQLEVLEMEVDYDGRMRTSFNIAGTETGRSSSSSSAFGTGSNLQNIDPDLRYVFVADQGYKICAIDASQSEARDLGFFCGCLFDDWTFLDNCELGDLHTNNSKLIWPELAWTGEPLQDRKIADRTFYRTFSYRDMAKRGGHLSNYSGTAWTASRSLKVPIQIMDEFQTRYVRGGTVRGLPVLPAFPCIPRYWQWCAEQLQTTGELTTPFGRRRHFFGRHWDDSTLREAIAFIPQSTTAERTNLSMWRIWKYEPKVQLLGNGYDSVIMQIPEGKGFEDTVERCLGHFEVSLRSTSGRTFVVPGEAKVGWNWGERTASNPGGLVKWTRGKSDERQRAIGIKRIMQG